MTDTRLSPADWLAAATVVVLWGLNFVAVKTALVGLPPLLLTSLRFAGVALILAPLFRPRRDQLPAVLGVAAVLGVGHFGLLFFALNRMEAATTAIVTQLGVPFSVLLAWAAFGERLGAGRALGLVLAFGGVAVLAGEPSLPHPLPLLIGMAAMAAWAVSNVLVKRLGSIHPLALNGWMAVFAAPMLLAASLLVEDNHMEAVTGSGWAVWAGLGYTMVAASVVAYSLWYGLLARHSMTRVVPVTLLAPVVAVTAGVLVLGEALTWQKLVGGLITVTGVAAVQFLGRRPPPIAKAEPEPGA